MAKLLKLLLIQGTIMLALLAAFLYVVPASAWPSLQWRGRAVDDVTSFLNLQTDSIRPQSLPVTTGFGLVAEEVKAERVSTSTLI